MDLLEFEEIAKKINKNKYHIVREIGFKEGKPTLFSWKIWRKNMTEEEYYDPKNLTILSSDNGNTIEDVKKLIEEE